MNPLKLQEALTAAMYALTYEINMQIGTLAYAASRGDAHAIQACADRLVRAASTLDEIVFAVAQGYRGAP